MLLHVAIDPEATRDLGEQRLPPLLVRLLRDKALVVTETDRSRAQLLTAISSGPSELQAMLRLLVQSRCRVTGGPQTPIGRISSPADLATWHKAAELLFLARDRIDSLALDELPEDPEVSLLVDALSTKAVAELEDRWTKRADAGDKREAVWNEVFRPFASHSQSVLITETYAGPNLVSAISKGLSKQQAVGAQWFLNRLARAGVRTIELATSRRELRNAGVEGTARQLVSDWFERSDTEAEFRLHLVDGPFDHARTIIFDGWVGFDIHKGMASFDSSELSEAVNLNPSITLGRRGRDHFEDLAGRAWSE